MEIHHHHITQMMATHISHAVMLHFDEIFMRFTAMVANIEICVQTMFKAVIFVLRYYIFMSGLSLIFKQKY